MRERELRKITVGLAAAAVTLALAACSSDDKGKDASATTSLNRGAAPAATSSSAPPSTAAPTTTLPGSAGCSSNKAVTTQRRHVDFQGVSREYQLSIPPGYEGAKAAPLILNIHGFTSNIEEQDIVSNLPAMGGARGYVVVTPQGETRTTGSPSPDGTPQWNVDLNATGRLDDVHFLLGIVDSLQAELCIDKSRVYVAGVSNGASMTMALRCAAGARFAAMAPVAGVNIGPTCPGAAAVPLITFHGDADPLVPYGGRAGGDSVEAKVSAVAKDNGCTGAPETTSPFDDARHLVATGCPNGMDVELWHIIGGGHTWPGVTTYVDPNTARKNPDGSPKGSPYGAEPLVKHQSTNVVATTFMLDFFDKHRRTV
jgi:polyhydroxybutyrate depolymerase